MLAAPIVDMWSSVSGLFLGQCSTTGECSATQFCCRGGQEYDFGPPRITMYGERSMSMGGPEVYEEPCDDLAARFASQSAIRSPRTDSRNRRLDVPPHQLWSLDAENVSPQSDAEVLLHQALSQFTRTMQRGIEVRVLLDDGQLLDVTASLDVSATQLVLRVNEAERNIALADVEQVCGPDETHEACTTNREYLSDCCVTLVLSSTHFLTFSFDSAHMREYFETCLKALVAGGKASPTTWRSDPKAF